MGKAYESIDELMGTGLETTGKGTKQRASAIDVASRGRETFFGSKKRAIATGVGILGIWSFLGYNKEVVPSPTEAVNAIIDGAQWVISIPDQIWGEDEPSSASPNTVAVITPSTTEKITETSAVQTSGNPTNLVPVTVAPQTSVPQTTVSSITTGAAEVLPPVVQYSPAAGSVVCDGPIVNIVINPDSGVAPLTQMAQQTGEPWNQGQSNSTVDAVLYEEASQGRLEFPVRTSCDGLEQ